MGRKADRPPVVGDPAGLTAAILVPACVYIAWMCLQPMTDCA